jgi:hypothetical protein
LGRSAAVARTYCHLRGRVVENWTKVEKLLRRARLRELVGEEVARCRAIQIKKQQWDCFKSLKAPKQNAPKTKRDDTRQSQKEDVPKVKTGDVPKVKTGDVLRKRPEVLEPRRR